MRNTPLNGWLSSRMRNNALPTAKAPKASAVSVVALRRERSPYPQKRISAHDTTITTSGQDSELASCSDTSRRVCSIAAASPSAAAANWRWAGVFGSSEAT